MVDRTLLQSAKSAWNRLPSASAVRDRGVECPLGPRLAPGRSTSGQLDTTLLLLHHHRYQVTQVRVYNPSQVKSSHERRAPYLFLAALRTRISSVLVIALYLSLQLALVSLFMANRSLYKATASRDSFRTLSSSCDSLLGVTDIVICQFPAQTQAFKDLAPDSTVCVACVSVGALRGRDFAKLRFSNFSSRRSSSSFFLDPLDLQHHRESCDQLRSNMASAIKAASLENRSLRITWNFGSVSFHSFGNPRESANKPSSSSFCNRIETRL